MAKTRALRPKKSQKRGCANVPVPREEVLVAGKVPKGCRFETGGGVLCTPAVAEKHGVIEVERKKAVARKKAAPKKKSAAKTKASGKKKRTYCYSENSKLPYLKDSLKEGKRKKLKKGCKKDPRRARSVATAPGASGARRRPSTASTACRWTWGASVPAVLATRASRSPPRPRVPPSVRRGGRARC